MRLLILPFIAVAIALGSSVVHAQLSGAFPVWFKLHDADIDAIAKAEDRILAHDPIKVGIIESWEGAGTGNTGKVSVVKLYKRNGADCIQAAYDFNIARAADPIRYVLPWCKFSDGTWKLVF